MSQPHTVILVGAGHAHLYVAAHAETLVERGARVVLVDPAEFWYSGLATGMLGGMYQPTEDQVNPRALMEAHGGEFIQDRVEAVETGARRLRLAGGGELAYDYLSINVGSRVNVGAIPGAAHDPSVWSVTPVSNLWKVRELLDARFRGGETPRVAVVGGGPTGSEVAANLTALATRHDVDMPVTLVTRSDRLIKQAPAGAARALLRNLNRRGVAIRTHTRIVRREGESLIADDGGHLNADVVVLATGLEANPLVQETGLPARSRKGLRINAKLHSIADERVFAGGDCAAMEGFDLPKLGVFGVRQAAYIHTNLLASLDGKPLAEYEPQKRYLAILNLGDSTALSTWGPFWWNGRSSMWLKDFIDRRFLEGYRQHSGNTQQH
ncbi:MAG: FAD-dependent oxidoreductase [Gemmatimonadetes bacterium]|nr:FAD-dependent oxidoreductase [Gemmatimonadota bacterium]